MFFEVYITVEARQSLLRIDDCSIIIFDKERRIPRDSMQAGAFYCAGLGGFAMDCSLICFEFSRISRKDFTARVW